MFRTSSRVATLAGLSKDSCRSFTRVRFPKPLKTKSFGIDIIHDSLWNKGMAFSRSERDRLGLRGLLPPAIRSIDVQVSRCMQHMEALADPVSKNLYLQDLQGRNETLFHRVLLENIEMMAPLIYTPTVGIVCQECKHLKNVLIVYWSLLHLKQCMNTQHSALSFMLCIT